ncbi:hypothetical protein ACG904_02020 [Acinetobacter guillouiae]|uniref:hypothetical protein n=1 Tax=Acinetobacter guillouiae TaxID=106649 RepID=UPI003AF82BDC
MTPSLLVNATIISDTEIFIDVDSNYLIMSGYDLYSDFGIPSSLDYIQAHNKNYLTSDGHNGIIAQDLPIDGRVIILQIVGDRYMQVGSTDTVTGEWSISNLRNSESIAIAFKEGYNAGIVSGIVPEV